MLGRGMGSDTRSQGKNGMTRWQSRSFLVLDQREVAALQKLASPPISHQSQASTVRCIACIWFDLAC
jgi:hypothetical protein